MENQYLCYSTEKYTGNVICVDNIITLNHNRILVKVCYCALTQWDAKLPKLDIIKWYLNKQSIAYDFAGVVVEVDQGNKAHGFKSGDEVYGSSYGVCSNYINVSAHEICLMPTNIYFKHMPTMITPIMTLLKVTKEIGLPIPTYVQERIDNTANKQVRFKIPLRERSRSQFDEDKYRESINWENRMIDTADIEKEYDKNFNQIKSYSDTIEAQLNHDSIFKKQNYDHFINYDVSFYKYTEDRPEPYDISILVIGASSPTGVYSAQILRNVYNIKNVIGIGSETKRDYVIKSGYTHYYSYEKISLENILSELESSGIKIKCVIDYTNYEQSNKNEFEIYNYYKEKDINYASKNYYRISINPKKYLNYYINSEQFCKFPRLFDCNVENLNFLRGIVDNYFCAPLMTKEFEFEIQEVERALKYLINKDTNGNVVVRVGDITESTINREKYLIARIREKKSIDYRNFTM
eukprot:Mrub_03316.p1 GENE.Mrub_03316~~Mrub_03316.p1  ORF type:complete len:479 (-),score=79.89 Mrub_03316:45-1439(-)